MSKKYIVKDEIIVTYKYKTGSYITQTNSAECFVDSKNHALELVNSLADDYKKFLEANKYIIVCVYDDKDFKIIISREITSSIDRIYEYRLVVLER